MEDETLVEAVRRRNIVYAGINALPVVGVRLLNGGSH